MRLLRAQLVFVALALTPAALAQPVPSKEPSSTHIFPAGGRRGTVVPVRVGGECLPPGCNFHLLGKGVAAPPLLGPRAKARYEPSAERLPTDADGGERIAYPKEWQSQLSIAADAPLGPVQWRVTCGWGGTQPRPFLVGDLPEFIETEPNSDAQHAERVILPVVVNGQIAGERDVDFYRFAAHEGEVVVCDVLARRIDSPLDAVVEVRDAQGRRMALQQLWVGGDPVLAFSAPASGDYVLNIANLGHRGGPEYVYRMTLSAAPYVPFAFPQRGRAGTRRPVELFALSGGDRFRAWKETVSFPTLLGSVRLEAGGADEVIADEGNSADTALSLNLPASVSGRFPRAGAEHWFRFTVKKGEPYTLTCRPYPPASAARPVVALEDEAGKVVGQASGADSADRLCQLAWKAPADGIYHLRVRDLQHSARGGSEFLYRLSFGPARPDFSLGIAADYVNVLQGGKAELDVTVRRSGGFTGPVDLVVSGLPAGITAEPARVAEGQTLVKLVLTTKDDTRPVNAQLRVVGRAVLAGNIQERVALATPAGGAEGVCADLPNDAVRLTVQHKPIFKLTCNEAYQYAPRGTVYPYTLQVERLNGFDGEITLQICDRQVQDLDGIEVVERIVPRGIKDIGALVYLPETMHANVQHHCRPYVQGYASFTDRWGQKQAMLAICDKRCMIRTTPPVAKLRAADASIPLGPGAAAECRLVLERTSNFAGPMDVELRDPPPGVSADKVRIEAGQTTIAVRVQVGGGATQRPLALRFRGTGQLAGGAVVVSETRVELR